MKQEWKDKWVAALRSGDYEQGKKRLKAFDDKYCCLGVLCDLVIKENPEIGQWYLLTKINDWAFVEKNQIQTFGLLPDCVISVVGMQSNDGKYSEYDRLIVDNDVMEYPFETIAKIIETNWELL